VNNSNTLNNSASKTTRAAHGFHARGMPAQDPLLDLAKLAALPFSVRWLFTANSHLRGQLSGRGRGGARLPDLVRTPE
jgi:hypothetical protein